MAELFHSPFRQRVVRAAEAVLQRNGSVGPLDVFQEMRLLPPSHFQNWCKGLEGFKVLLPRIQAGPAKIQQTIDFFKAWTTEKGLVPVEAAHTRLGVHGVETLQVTEHGDPAWEAFYRTHYAPRDLPAKKVARLVAKLQKPPDLVVFEKVGDAGKCSECQTELLPGDFLLLEKGQPLCLTCADLDQLVFLPAGNTALSRRSRQHSSLAAVVVRFSRARNQYERQGLLVTEAGLAKAEALCELDAPTRTIARERAARARTAADHQFVTELTRAIVQQYPGCPIAEAGHIAEHTGRRNSGRVGRSAAGRALDASALELAVVAHIRHVHTNYDELLMGGTARLDARALVRGHIHRVLAEWSGM